MKINFKKIELFTDVAHTNCVISDCRKGFADIIYNMGNGIACKALAVKIFNSEGEQDFDEEECKIIKAFAEKCTPSFIDAIDAILMTIK